MSASMTSKGTDPATPERKPARGSYRALVAVLLVCLAPVLASYFAYYVIRPDGRTNYGTLLEPLRSVSQLTGTALDGSPAGLEDLKGRWVLLTGATGSECDAECEHRLYLIRQLRLTTGKERERVERAWIVPADAQPSPELLAKHEGLKVIRVPDGALARAGFVADEGARPGEHIWIIDPLGNLVMRYPVAPDANRIKKDLAKLLKASRIG